MSSRAVRLLLLWSTASAACHGKSTAPPRERVLARVPADAQIVLAADGKALAGPRIRAVVDVLRPRWPARFGCVIDAALASDHVAVGISASRDLTVVISTRTAVTCPPLSKIGDDLWIATLGNGKAATAGSVLDAEAHARARPYLATAPIAASIVLPGVKVLATLAPDPLEGWLAIDTPDIPSALAEQRVRGVVDRMARTESTAALAQTITISHDGPQVVARLSDPVEADLAIAVRTVLAWYAAPTVRATIAFTCPPLAPPIIGCANGTTLTVSSLQDAVGPLLAAEVTVIVENERVAWLRLGGPVPSLGLARGDRLLAVDGRHLTSGAQFADLLHHARHSTSITIQRDAVTATLELAER